MSRSGLIPNSGWPRSRNHPRFGAVGRGEREAEAAEFALGVEHDDDGVVVAQVAEVEAEHRRALARALAADEQGAILAVVGVDQAGAVARAQHRQQRVGERPVMGQRRRREHARGRGLGLAHTSSGTRRVGLSGVANSSGGAATGACGSARRISGGIGMRGTALRRTGTPFMRADGSASRCATSAAETRERGAGEGWRWRSGGGRGSCA